MPAPRLIFVSRQFWPLVGGAQTMMAELARACVAEGAEVTLLTARWRANWPAEVDHHGVRVIRLPTFGLRMVGTWRYMRALRRWLVEHRGQYDAVYVSMLKHDAYAALATAAQTQKPIVLRPEGTGATGDIAWQAGARFGRALRRRCQTAPAIVTIAPTVADELGAAGYDPARMHAIPNGVAIPPATDPAQRAAARRMLANADARFRLPGTARLIVYTGRLHPHKGLNDLIRAWPDVLAAHPQARLWIVGDGSDALRLRSMIDAAALTGSIVMAGQYDAVQEFYQAADLAVLPSHEELMSLALLEAMAAGLPVVASDIPGNRYVVDDGQQGLLVPPGDPPALAAALGKFIADEELRIRCGSAARQHVAAQFSLASMTRAHLELFEQ